ncbi:hypothetical protein P152DRAFT_482717 [Eremomyces bilateralis CBS 781.70]|uniref:chitin synthase n=1 Tax=Eremomyces bilateralis CBS 781.70 TaxID=1392243 RepID=A0A6G1G0V1_9PEZI|nr:uncharacterized protein P152DRAFT_482717 [Eremomyces bilateralis CBS 781.70]KAF1811684.1 hypothetical protein P152DRAFT_482717 [Eremomyces bilateralis CBS 781.70]
MIGLLGVNGALIYIAWKYKQSHYIFLVLLAMNTFLQAVMIMCLIIHYIFTRLLCCCLRRKEKIPDRPERICMVIPCYNETRHELERSLDSLVRQQDLDGHARMALIIVDGNVKGKGMEKTTQEHLLDDILLKSNRTYFRNGYRARDGLFMACTVQDGYYKGLPYILIGKRYNQGKRDSLCFIRSFLYHFCNRSQGIETIFNPKLFDHLANLLIIHGLNEVDYLVGIDADTVLADDCVSEMVKVIRTDPKLVGVCGHVCVDFGNRPFGFWELYQYVEYSLTQGLRRMFQSRITGRVNCLPGCCQLLRVDQATFGDKVLREKFGYVPKPNDGMTKHIMGNYSEDSIHASVIFSCFPSKRTAQALKAKAYTVVPDNWRVFLSQRKRWSLGSISNEFVMAWRPGILLIERICSIITCITWFIMPFIIAAFAELIWLLVRKGPKIIDDHVFIGLLSVLVVRYIYSFLILAWLPSGFFERLQFFVGFFIHLLASPFMNIIIIVYSLFYSDDFKWGKTREVVEEEDTMEEKRPMNFYRSNTSYYIRREIDVKE